MKNIQPLISRDEIHQHFKNSWRSEEFRRSHEEGGYVYQLIDRLANMPCFIADMTDPHHEHAHFSAWWRVFPNRDYQNDAVHDLYWLHEITHAVNMPFIADLPFESFKRKMFDNELDASVVSEIMIYFEFPSLRGKSFNHPIYADRFLNDPAMQALYAEDPHAAFQEIRERRRNVAVGMAEKDMDPTEKWIKRFADQNEAWAGVWHHRYNEVECAMKKLWQESHDPAVGRVAAAKNFIGWLQSPAVTEPGQDIPFLDEAIGFAGIYHFTKGKYNKAMQAIAYAPPPATKDVPKAPKPQAPKPQAP